MDENNPLISHVISDIYSCLKEHMDYLCSIKDKESEIYNDIKNYVIKCLSKYLNINNPDHLIRKNISDILMIILLSGLFYCWPNSIEDLINETKNSNLNNGIEFCYIVLRALGSIDLLINKKEISFEKTIYISEKEKYLSKKLIEKKNIVKDFLLDIYNNINNISNENMKQKIIVQILDTTKCWTNFELDLLKLPHISKMIYSIINSINIENPLSFSEMICDSIKKSKNSKLYNKIERKIKKENEEDEQDDEDEEEKEEDNKPVEILLRELENKIDIEEKKWLDDLLNFILPKIIELKEKEKNKLNNYEKKMLETYAKILAEILEDYIYFFFNFNDKKTGIVLNLFRYFLKHKSRTISSLFFDALEEMETFINYYYKFYGLNDSQKIEFVNYLMDIIFGVMENCSYKKLEQNDMSLLEKEILDFKNDFDNENEKQSMQNNLYQNKDLEGYDEDQDFDLNFFRTNAETVFSHIFLIIIKNFKDEGVSVFLNTIFSSLYLDEIKQNNYINSKYLDIKIDIIFYVLSSLNIFENYHKHKYSIDKINDMIKSLSFSEIICQNKRLFIDYLILINKFTNIIIYDLETFKKVSYFLLHKNSDIEIIKQSCYQVLLKLFREINCYIKLDNIFINEVFNEVYNVYQKVYNKYQYKSKEPLENIVEILLLIIGINKELIPEEKTSEDNNNFNINLNNFLSQIASPIIDNIKTLINSYIKDNKDINKYKQIFEDEFEKCFLLEQKIISSLNDFSKPLKIIFFKEYLEKKLITTQAILENFINDEDIVDFEIKFYLNYSDDIIESYHEKFHLINNILIWYFLQSKEHYKIIEILKYLYYNLLNVIKQEKQIFMENNKYILEQYYLIMKTFIENFSKEEKNNNNKLIEEKIRMISEFHYYIFVKLNFKNDKLITNDELIKYYNLLKKIIDFLTNCVTLLKEIEVKMKINEMSLSPIIQSFNSFLLNTSLIKEFFIQKNGENNSSIFIDIIIASWKFIFFYNFKSSSKNYLIDLYQNAFKYDINLFIKVFEICISKSNKFNNTQIKSIIEYLIKFQNYEDNIKKIFKFVFENIRRDGIIDENTFNDLIK